MSADPVAEHLEVLAQACEASASQLRRLKRIEELAAGRQAEEVTKAEQACASERAENEAAGTKWNRTDIGHFCAYCGWETYGSIHTCRDQNGEPWERRPLPSEAQRDREQKPAQLPSPPKALPAMTLHDFGLLEAIFEWLHNEDPKFDLIEACEDWRDGYRLRRLVATGHVITHECGGAVHHGEDCDICERCGNLALSSPCEERIRAESEWSMGMEALLSGDREPYKDEEDEDE